jgi:hypothetical protein
VAHLLGSCKELEEKEEEEEEEEEEEAEEVEEDPQMDCDRWICCLSTGRVFGGWIIRRSFIACADRGRGTGCRCSITKATAEPLAYATLHSRIWRSW